jgi:chemotaxis protein methyltransferase CheR
VGILATDLDSNVLATGERGIYTSDRFEEMEPSLRERWFQQEVAGDPDQLRVDPRLADLITFEQLNLLKEWPMRGHFDVIMCRNVLIYFDKPTQQRLIRRFADLLRPGGLLILGHSESIAKGSSDLLHKGQTMYEKCIADAE